MIDFIVKYQSGSLGNFLACILHEGTLPTAIFDYGTIVQNKILHTGAYVDPNDKHFQAYYDPQQHRIVSHNNPNFEGWITRQKNTRTVFIDLTSHFVEYRLNFMMKMPEWNMQLNKFAVDNSWRGFKFPISNDDARRIVRLHENKEQIIPVDREKDIRFPFKNFYITDKDIWIKTFNQLTQRLEIDMSIDKLAEWFNCFQEGQKAVIDRARIIYDCINHKRFIAGLNENEKGIIIGYHAVKDNADSAEYFEKTYEECS